jgi:hypothetical protein
VVDSRAGPEGHFENVCDKSGFGVAHGRRCAKGQHGDGASDPFHGRHKLLGSCCKRKNLGLAGILGQHLQKPASRKGTTKPGKDPFGLKIVTVCDILSQSFSGCQLFSFFLVTAVEWGKQMVRRKQR